MNELKNNNKVFKISEAIPNELLIPSAGNHLYRIGISHFRNGSEKRHRIYNPWLIAVTNCIFLSLSVFIYIKR